MNDHGSTTIWMMIVPVLLLFLGGLAVDLWGALDERSRIASIADEAAAAGVTATDVVTDAEGQHTVLTPQLARQRSLESVDTHPYVAHVTSRNATATETIVVVTVTGQYEPTMLRLIGVHHLRVEVTGAAAPVVGQ